MNELNLWDVIIGSIVCMMYIVGKVWMYHNHTKDTKKPNKGIIKRGPEWDN
jgi:hypothetical protein